MDTSAIFMLGSEIMYDKWSWKNMHISKITERRPCENCLKRPVLRYGIWSTWALNVEFGSNIG